MPAHERTVIARDCSRIRTALAENPRQSEACPALTQCGRFCRLTAHIKSATMASRIFLSLDEKPQMGTNAPCRKWRRISLMP